MIEDSNGNRTLSYDEFQAASVANGTVNVQHMVEEVEPDLELEGQAIANMLAVMNQLPRKSKDRVLTVVIDLAAPGPMSHSQGQIITNFEALRRSYGDGDESA